MTINKKKLQTFSNLPSKWEDTKRESYWSKNSVKSSGNFQCRKESQDLLIWKLLVKLLAQCKESFKIQAQVYKASSDTVVPTKHVASLGLWPLWKPIPPTDMHRETISPVTRVVGACCLLCSHSVRIWDQLPWDKSLAMGKTAPQETVALSLSGLYCSYWSHFPSGVSQY